MHCKPREPCSFFFGIGNQKRCSSFQNECSENSGTEKQPKHKVFGRDLPEHPGPIRRDIPDKNFTQVAFSVVLDGVAGMSRDLGRDVLDLEKLYARKLWVDFLYPKNVGFL